MTGTRMMKAPQGPGGVKTARVVADREQSEEGDVVDNPDQRPKQHRTKAGDDAHHNRQQR